MKKDKFALVYSVIGIFYIVYVVFQVIVYDNIGSFPLLPVALCFIVLGYETDKKKENDKKDK